MKLETRANQNLAEFFFQQRIPFLNRSFRLTASFYRTPDTWVTGYSSRTIDGQYVLFHDYDSLELSDVVEELKALQQIFQLSEYYVFELDRENSFHAVCLDKMHMASAYKIQQTTSCDLAFVHSIKRMKNKEWILRIGSKGKRDAPKHLFTLPSNHNLSIKSLAHAKLLEKMGVKIDWEKGRWDLNSKVGIVKYTTANRLKNE